MQIEVHAPSDEVVVQVNQLLLFYLTGLDGEVDRIAIRVERRRDRLGVPLHHCHVTATVPGNSAFTVEETQGDLVLAITRALDRTVRTLHRRLTWQLRFA